MIHKEKFALYPHKQTQRVDGLRNCFHSVEAVVLSCPVWKAAGPGRNHHFNCSCRSMTNSTWYIVVMTTSNWTFIFCTVYLGVILWRICVEGAVLGVVWKTEKVGSPSFF